MLNHGNPFATRAKMLAHVERLAEWKRSGDAFPVLIEINPTNYCNESCDFCISKYAHLGNSTMTATERAQQVLKLEEHSAISNHPERRRGIEFSFLKRFLFQAREMGLKAVNWSGGGEPTSYQHFRDAVRYCAELGGLDQGLFTNGLFPASHVPDIGNHLRWVRVSLDTLNPARYEAQKHTRGFAQVIRNIEQLVKYQVKVNINMNLADWNFDEVERMALRARDVGTNACQIRPVLALPFENAGNAPYRQQPGEAWLQRAKSRLREAEQIRTEKFQVLVSWDKVDDLGRPDFGRTYNKCLYHFFICVLNANGDLCVCMYHLGDKRFTFGSVYESTVEEIWGSPQRKAAIAMCANTLDLSTCQVCCKGHEINKFMHEVETTSARADVNFL